MSESLTHIIVILDRSGSMDSCKQATIDGFDEFINKQKREEGDATITLVQFDDEYEVLYDDKNIKDVVSIKDVYQPRGMTAMFDAVGRAIVTTKMGISMKSRRFTPDKVMCIIITDGYENASKEYNRDQIVKLIREQEAGNWEFVFLGANMDAVATATSLGMKGGSAATYNTCNMDASFDVLSAKCGSYRSMSGVQLESLKDGSEELFTIEDREELA